MTEPITIINVGDIVDACFNESHWDRRPNPYKCEVISAETKRANRKDYTLYELKVLAPITTGLDAANYRLVRHAKEVGGIYELSL